MDEKITKQDIENIVNGAINSFAIIINQAFSDQQKYIDDKIEGLDKKTNTLYDRMDKLENKIDEVREEARQDHLKTMESNEIIITELKNARQEQMAMIGGQSRIGDTLFDHGDKIKDHDKRIVKLETIAGNKILASVSR